MVMLYGADAIAATGKFGDDFLDESCLSDFLITDNQ